MKTRAQMIRSSLLALSGFLLFFYIIYHAFEGRYSLVSTIKMEQDVVRGKALLDDLTQERRHLKMLTLNIDKVVDLDLVEEEARKNGLILPKEILVPLP